MELHLISRDGNPIGIADAAPQGVGLIQWFHARHGGFSMDWAIANEGYSVQQIEELDCRAVTPLLESIATRESVTMAAVFVPFSKSRNAKPSKDGKPWLSLNWKVTIQRFGRTILETDYSQGSGHAPSAKRKTDGTRHGIRCRDHAVELECEFGRISRPQLGSDGYGSGREPIPAPSIGDILHSLCSDADVLDSGGFESWAANFGYDTDSRAAEKIYQACIDSAMKLRAGLGESLLSEMRLVAQFN